VTMLLYYGTDTRGWRCVLQLSVMVRALATAVSIMVLVTIVGCAPSGPAWVDSGATYTTSSLAGVFDKADISKFKDRPVSEAGDQRQKALTALRMKGKQASQAADLITKILPADSSGIPVYVERATVGGQSAYVLVEAIGPSGGKLSTKRMWALADNGAVLWVGTR
jgi:hypothetical protein